jgi:uncharacterized protein with gpF-like domain
MAPRRFIHPTMVARWDRQLRDAVSKAMDEMRAHVRATLATHGVHALVAAPIPVWNSAQWQAAVNANVAPVADDISDEAVNQAQASVPTQATWGMPSPADAISAAIVASVIAAGAYIGARLTDNLASSTDAAQAAEDVFSTASDIVGNASNAEMIANYASSDVSSYVAYMMGNIYSDATREWASVGDDRTRDSHLDADGQVVGLNEPFIVGGESLMFPGDPDGSEEETAGCRCWILTDGIDPGVAIYGPDEESGIAQRSVSDENRAARATSTPSTPRSYPT